MRLVSRVTCAGCVDEPQSGHAGGGSVLGERTWEDLKGCVCARVRVACHGTCLELISLLPLGGVPVIFNLQADTA